MMPKQGFTGVQRARHPLCRDAPAEDREARKSLWPQIEQARREGKRAYYRGPHGYIDG